MKIKALFIAGISSLMFAGGLCAQSSSETDKANAQTVITTVPAITDARIPSAYQFLITLCEVKEGVYYMPRTKFDALTESQQKYVRNNRSLFVIND